MERLFCKISWSIFTQVWFQNRRAKFRKTERLTQSKSTNSPKGEHHPPTSPSSSSTSPEIGHNGADSINNNNNGHQLQVSLRTLNSLETGY